MTFPNVHKVQKQGNSLAVSLPIEIARALKIERGDVVSIVALDGETILIRKVNNIN